MSEAQEDPNLLAGHAPAVKVGGMRVAQHKKHTEKPEEPESKEDQEEFEVPAKPDKHHQQILLSGAVTKGDKDFPEAAVRAMHDKPHPVNENKQQRNVHTQGPRVLQQPRKQ